MIQTTMLGIEEVEPGQDEWKGKAAELIMHLNTRTGRKFHITNITTKSIIARLKECEDVYGIKIMINRQVDLWKGTDMEQHLNPITLFRPSNFFRYYVARNLPVKKKADYSKGF